MAAEEVAVSESARAGERGFALWLLLLVLLIALAALLGR